MSVKDIIEAVKAGAEAVTEVLKPVQEIGGAMWDGMAKHAEHGASELASAMYTGNAYVAYGWGNEGPDVKPQEQVNSQVQDAKPWETEKAQEVKPPEQEQDNGMQM